MASRSRRVPRTRYPRNLENWYGRELVKLINQWRKAAMIFTDTYLKQDVSGGVPDIAKVQTDAKDGQSNIFKQNLSPYNYQRLLRNLDLMGATIKQATNDQVIRNLALRFVRAINSFSYNNVKAQVGIVGINPIQASPQLNDYVETKIQQNTDLIKYRRDDYVGKLKGDIYQAITQGGGVTAIRKSITDRTGMETRHAQLVATDQTGTITGQIDAYRDQAAGVEKYVWRTQEDDRVRKKHQELDGKTFTYGDPNGGDDGMIPGEPINCRCFADPVIDL